MVNLDQFSALSLDLSEGLFKDYQVKKKKKRVGGSVCKLKPPLMNGVSVACLVGFC